jgi:hypothetical protein
MIGAAAIRMAWGTVLLLVPNSVLRTVGARRGDARASRVARMLGARQLLQGVIAVRHRSRSWILGGAAVDATHAATMLALAIKRPDYRRPAMASALTAGCFTVAGLRAVRRREP